MQMCYLNMIILEALWAPVMNSLLLCCSLEKSLKQTERPWTGPLTEKEEKKKKKKTTQNKTNPLPYFKVAF